MIFNLPNTLTWGRILLIPVIVGVFFVPDTMFDRPTQNLVATAVFILAAVTDWLDGKHTVFGHVTEGQDVVNKIAMGDKINTLKIVRVGEKAKAFKGDQADFEKFSK